MTNAKAMALIMNFIQLSNSISYSINGNEKKINTWNLLFEDRQIYVYNNLLSKFETKRKIKIIM